MYLVMFHKNWKSFLRNIAVTSLAEVWIETVIPALTSIIVNVTSLAEVWIETLKVGDIVGVARGHFPCGSVD